MEMQPLPLPKPKPLNLITYSSFLQLSVFTFPATQQHTGLLIARHLRPLLSCSYQEIFPAKCKHEISFSRNGISREMLLHCFHNLYARVCATV